MRIDRSHPNLVAGRSPTRKPVWFWLLTVIPWGTCTSDFFSAGRFAPGLPAARAEMFGKDYQPCGEQPTTVAIVACAEAKAKVWDQRLNAAYGKLRASVDPQQHDALQAAQRLWLQYRDANCRFYAAQEGTIRQILAAECLRSMTQDRASELTQAAKP